MRSSQPSRRSWKLTCWRDERPLLTAPRTTRPSTSTNRRTRAVPRSARLIKATTCSKLMYRGVRKRLLKTSSQAVSAARTPRPPRQWAPPVPHPTGFFDSRWNTVSTHHVGGHLRGRIMELSHPRIKSTLATGLPYLHSLHATVTETASSHAEPFATRPIPAHFTGQTGSGTIAAFANDPHALT